MAQTAVILLAAGGSSRLGASKMLLRLPGGKSLVQHVAHIVLEAPYRPVLVVLGRDAEEVRASLPAACTPLVNPHWQKGISTSIRLGISQLPSECETCLVVLADQPFQSAALLQRLVEVQWETSAQVVFPEVSGQRTNPVVLHRSTFQAIQDLAGDAGARQLFDRFTTAAVPWDDPRLLLDIDTEDDFQQAQAWMIAGKSCPGA